LSGDGAGKRKSNAFNETALTKTKISELALLQLAALPLTPHGPALKINFPDLLISILAVLSASRQFLAMCSSTEYRLAMCTAN
jgi:hypothetical protein